MRDSSRPAKGTDEALGPFGHFPEIGDPRLVSGTEFGKDRAGGQLTQDDVQPDAVDAHLAQSLQ